MAKPGARTTWMGWFPRSFTNLLTSFQIPTKKAHELALRIRNTITIGMDDIWRERNTAQHVPKERKEINPRVLEAFEKKTRLGLDQGPHTKAEDITNLPHRMKKKWLENAQKRIDDKEENRPYRLGLIAQDVEAALPSNGKFANLVGSFQQGKGADQEELISVAYERLTCVLWTVVKDQQKQLQELTARVASLESK